MNLEEFETAYNLCNASASKAVICAATKQVDKTEIEQAIEAGIRHFGENYVQEAFDKYDNSWWPYYKEHGLKLRMLGHLQRNKAAKAARFFDAIDSVDSLELAQILNKSREGLPPLEILLQYNPCNDVRKYGITELGSLVRLAQSCVGLPNLKLNGIMIIVPIGDSKKAFEEGQLAFKLLKQDCASIEVLSMGMSVDYQLALKYGSTMVRLGQSLFGSRTITER